VTGPELDTGDTPIAVFNVTLSGTPSSPVTVNYTVDPGTATPGADYSPASGVVAFNAGETSKIIEVAIIGDNDPEADETFFVNLTSASGAAIGDGQGVGTIVDDDENVVLVNVVSNLPLDPPLISDRFVKVADVVLTGLGAGTTLSAQGSVGPYEGGDWLRIGPANEVLFDYNRAAFQEYGEEYLFALNFFVLADDPVNGLGTDAQSSVAVVTFETRPVGINDEYLAQSGRPFTYDVLGNDDDFDSDPLTAIFLGGPYYYSEDGSQVADTQTSISLSSSGSVTINGTAFESDVPEGELSRLTYFEYAAVDPDGNESLPVEVRVEIVVEADPDDDDADGDGEPDGSGSEDENPNDPNLPGDPNGNDGGTGGGGNNANSPNNPGGSDLPPGPGGQGGGAGNGESGVWGDIHVTTFGRLKYDFQAIGEFVAARATDGDPFELQIRTGAWGSTASVTTAIATSIDGHKVSYDTLTNEIRIDDAVVSMAANTSIALGGGAVHRGNGDNYAFTYADDRQVVYAYDRGAYIDYLIVATADRVGEIVGIADSENGQLVLPDGSLLPSNPGYAAFYSGADSFANSWRISDAGSFFTYGAGESTATFSDPDFPPFAVSIADLPANLVAEATLRVDNAGITDPAIRDAAILDLVLTGDPRMLTSSQQAVDPTEALTVQSTPLPKLVGIGAETLALPEGNTGTTAFSFTVYRTNNVGALSVDYAVTTSGFNITSPVEADAFVGGLLPAGTVAFADGESSKTITIEIAGDANIETNEQFAVALGAVSSTEFGLLQPSVMALLQDDDAVKPTAVRDQFAADEGEIITGNVLANDTANNGVTLAARLVRLPENGTLTLNADGSFTYTPEAGFAGTDFFLYRATDAFSSSTSQIVQFDIARLDNTGPSVAVIAAPAPIVEAVDASAQIASARGTISITDPDNGDRLNATVSAPVVALNGAPVSSTLAAQFASLTAADALRFGPSVTSNGTPQTIAWNYQPAAADLDVLAAGDQLTITYQVRASDGAATSPAQPLIITIAGANDAATIGGTPTGTVTEDGTLTASGALTIADADDGEAVFVAPDAASLADAFGDFTFDAATGAWSYALDNARAALQALNAGDTRIETLSVASLDGTATQAISVTVQGADDAVAITNGNAGGTLKGTSRNDIFEPKGGIDIVKAGSGDDIIRAAINDDADFYYGGGGSDTVDYSALTRSISAQLDDMFCVGTGLVTGHQSGIDVLRSIENIVGTSADDTISGNRFANRLEGSGGNDWLTGDGGSDTFVFKPGFGNDRITDFDANPRGGQDYIELSGFGITADDFAARVTITDVGADTLVTIDDDPANTIRLVGIGKPATVGVDDFFLT
jgi:VCBS repeat-containing protein